MDNTDRGIFITFEGSEGCGKTTQFERLARRIAVEPATAGRRLVTLREPGGTPLGEEIRRLLKLTAPGWSILPEAELLLFAASRAQLVREVINPLLAEGSLVMCDRFLDSTTVYQGVGRRLNPLSVAAVNEFAAGPLRPDITFLLDLPTEVALARLQSRSLWANLPPDRMELELPDFYAEVRAGYLRLAEKHTGRFVVIDASRSPEKIETDIWGHLTERFHGFRTESGI
jgi:dTMP kinase